MKYIFRIYIYLFFFLFIYACVPHDQQGGSGGYSSKKELRTQDYIYEPNIKTPLLYALQGPKNFEMNPPIIPLNQTNGLMLEFDDLSGQSANYYVKLIHCNFDWSVSNLVTNQFIQDINEVFITDRKNSFGTRIPYIHYRTPLPPVKLSGNYIAAVYRNGDENDLILTKRFIVFENRIIIVPDLKAPLNSAERFTHQQIDFNIIYKDIDLANPQQNFNIVIRQNFRWDKAIYNLKPVFMNEALKRFEYTYFNGENNFPGYNEYRTFAIRSTNFQDINVDNLRTTGGHAQIDVRVDESNGTKPYVLFPDIDGRFVVEHYESKGRETEPDYVYVTFNLKSNDPAPGKVFVVGSFNDYIPDSNSEMIYFPEEKLYKQKVLLKQGYYNYRYALIRPGSNKLDEAYFEGSHTITQNTYDFIAYYRPIGDRADRVIGYKMVNYQGGNR
ncbi:MAG: DUF5103 domain-containing protein [Cytophagaceae bacterium]